MRRSYGLNPEQGFNEDPPGTPSRGSGNSENFLAPFMRHPQSIQPKPVVLAHAAPNDPRRRQESPSPMMQDRRDMAVPLRMQEPQPRMMAAPQAAAQDPRWQEPQARMMAAPQAVAQDRRLQDPQPRMMPPAQAAGQDRRLPEPRLGGQESSDALKTREMLAKAITMVETLKVQVAGLKEVNHRQHAELQASYAQKHARDKELHTVRADLEATRKLLNDKEKIIMDLEKKLQRAFAERDDLNVQLRRASDAGSVLGGMKDVRSPSPLARYAGRAAETVKSFLGGGGRPPPVPSFGTLPRVVTGFMRVGGETGGRAFEPDDELDARFAALYDEYGGGVAGEPLSPGCLIPDTEELADRLEVADKDDETVAAVERAPAGIIPKEDPGVERDDVSVAGDPRGDFYHFLQEHGLLSFVKDDISGLYLRIMGRQMKDSSLADAIRYVDFPVVPFNSAKAGSIAAASPVKRKELTENDLVGCFRAGSSLEYFAQMAKDTNCDKGRYPMHHFRLVVRCFMCYDCNTTRRVARILEDGRLA